MRLSALLLIVLAGCSRLVDVDGLSGGDGASEDGSLDGSPDGGGDGDNVPGDGEPEDGEPQDGTPNPTDGDAGPEPGDGDGGDDLVCPTTVKTMDMAKIRTTRGSYCIDKTEVTVAQYTDFLNEVDGTDVSGLFVTVGCSMVTEVRPEGFPPGPGTDQLPITGVTYCDAEAYCRFVGKSLCGDVSGGQLAAFLINNPTRDAWNRACGGAEKRRFPYGDSYDINACNGEGQAGNVLTPVENYPGCVTEDGVFDMSGNVWEWVASCESDVSLSDACAVRGGANNAPEGELACSGPQQRQLRAAQSSNIGFRCCAH